MEGRYIIPGDIIGIAFYGELFKIIQAEGIADGSYHLPYLSGREARGSSTSEIDGGDRGSLQIFTTLVQFGAEGIYITCGFFLTHGGKEAAVYTATGTKRNMYVNARQGVRSLS